MEQTQGQATDPQQPAIQPATPPAPPADISGLQQFLAEPEKPADVSGTQGQPPAQPDPNVVELQRIANQRFAENQALQSELQRLKGAQQTPEGKNPYDPQVDWANWLRYETQDAANRASRQTAEWIMQQAQVMSQQNKEFQWAQSHPGVDLNSVKAFAEYKGIRELDDAYAIMTMGQQTQGAIQQVQQNLLTQFRQPANVAQPVRAQGGQGTPVGLRFEPMLEAYSQNPNIENSWPPQVREAFHRELDIRARAES